MASGRVLSTNEFLSWYRSELERIGDSEDLDRWDRIVRDFGSAVEAFGEGHALEWLAIAFAGHLKLEGVAIRP